MKYVFLSLSLFVCACANPHYRDLPVASSTLVHACGAAEAEVAMKHMSDADPGPKITEVTVSIGTSGERSIGLGKWDIEASKTDGAEKTTEIKIEKLPSLSRCIELGYVLRVCTKNADESFNCDNGLNAKRQKGEIEEEK
jgi:hypothetical protein